MTLNSASKNTFVFSAMSESPNKHEAPIFCTS